MGRGDKRTKRGKIFRGSFGKTRPQGKKKGAKPAKPAANNA
jgi:30S ribosomal protein S31